MKYTTETYKTKVQQIHPELIVLGKYTRSHDKIRCKCNECGNEFDRVAKELFIDTKGCPECGRKRIALIKKQQGEEKFRKFLEGGTTKMIGPYNGRDFHTTFQCSICGYTWNTTPSSFYSNNNNSACPLCKAKKTSERCRKNPNLFLEQISVINPDIEILGEYTTNNCKIQYKCKKCGFVGESTPNHLLQGHGCPQCNISMGEKYIKQILEENKINFIPQYLISIDSQINLSGKAYIDFYLPDYNLFIEYNGIQHYVAKEYFGGQLKLEQQQKRDQYVRDYCKNNNINLIEISYENKTKENIKECLTFLKEKTI